jgi:1-acyl-sn-glycerol-3-phosphate acyltransferase
MNRSIEDTKYVFHPPKYSRFWASIIYPFADICFRRRAQKVVSVKAMSGIEDLRRLAVSGDGILITPNHSDHCDPLALMSITREMNIPLNFMATREIFEQQQGFRGFLMQRMGCFSINREGADIQAIKTAMQILSNAKYPLVMFPEGEIYHTNEHLTPLNEGAATLALKATARMLKADKTRSIHIIPTAMKYRYIKDISHTFPDRMARLEDRISWAPQTELSMVDRIYKFGEAVLSLKEKEFLNHTLDGSLDQRLTEFREILLQKEEAVYLGKPGKAEHPSRIRMIRGKIRTILLDEKKPPDEETSKRCYRSLDRLHMAIQLYSYPGQYLKEKPSMDRIAETIHKFEEDAFDKNEIYGKRIVEVTFGKPIDLSLAMDAYEKDSKATVADIMNQIETAIKNVLE